MDIHVTDLKKVSVMITSLFPGFSLKKGGFKRENSVQLVQFLTLITDALIKSENFRKGQNMELPGDHDFFTTDIIGILKNISFYLQRFETNIFKFTRTERQTFLFIIENIQEFLLNIKITEKKGSKAGNFLDYKFWIENYFKIIDQKITGVLLRGDEDLEKKKLIQESGETIGTNDLFFSSVSASFSLSPFVIIQDDNVRFLTGETDGILRYRGYKDKSDTAVYGKELTDELFLFRFANLDLWRGNKDLVYSNSDSRLGKALEKAGTAYELFRNGLYEKSFQKLNPLLPSLNDYPLFRLMQIKNLSKKNDMPAFKNSLLEFIKLNANYYQGFELLGLLYEKEENHEAAIEYYEKSVKLKQNKEILNRIKKLKAITEKDSGSREPAATTIPFINISQKVFISPGHIIAREKEIKEMIEILNSDSRNNLLLVGDSGVGKTALIKLLAQKIIDSEVPETMKGKNLMEINFVSLITGTKYRGQFEEKVVKLLNEFKVQKNILVLEDIHLMMSQGGARGTSMDLVNILKQFMRDKDIQVIATSSYEEFKSVIERDNSLMAFFQRMFIGQLSGENTIDVLKHERDKISESDNIVISDNLIEQIVENSRGNIMGKKYPDAALLIFERLISKSRLKSGNVEEYTVNTEDLSEVLSDILNLPDPDLSFTLKERLATLEKKINEKIVGQEEAVKKLTSGIVVSKLGYDIKDERPDGVFLFVGPTGVGKSETAIVLSKYLHGSEENLVRIDMSEYMERFTYSRFVGAAPGYVGYNDSTQLTDKIRQNPYSVILLDEIEKADYQLLNIFLQVFDAGRLTDARGNVIDFSHSTIIMTSNIGTDLFSKTRLGYQPGDEGEVTQTSLKKALKNYFSPEFLNRIDEIIVFGNLDRSDIKKIIGIQLEGTVKKLLKQGKRFKISDKLINFLVTKGYSREYGARNISRTIKNLLLEKIAHLSLKPEWDEGNLVNCTLKNGKISAEILTIPLIEMDEELPVNNERKGEEKEETENG